MAARRNREAELPPLWESTGSAVVARPIELEPAASAASSAAEGRVDLSAAELLPGAIILGKYVIRRELGRGAAAVVYEAEHLGLGRRVAFKVHLRDVSSPPELLARFRREARILASVRHPNVLEVYDNGELEDGSPFLVVECVGGQSLATRLEQGPLPIAEAVSLTKQLLSALQALAERGIAHRDLKPDNLMVDVQAGACALKVVDFGVAKWLRPQSVGDEVGRLTVPGGLVGTPLYMAPEQFRAEEADTRSDLYAVGAVLYEMLCGRPPHDGDTLDEVAKATLYGPIPRLTALRPDCPEVLEQIVMCALSRPVRHAGRAHRAGPRLACRGTARDSGPARGAGPTHLLGARRRGCLGVALVGGVGVAGP
jgi:serine/threonine protein kinase